jgi:hypothetical protein
VDDPEAQRITMINFRQIIDFYFLGRHRLEGIQMLSLGSSLADAISLYGDPTKSEPSEETPEITQHTFSVGSYHSVVASEWKKTIQSITYWSEKSDPARDLQCVLERYKDSSDWQVMEEGYLYQRRDGVLRLWCSAIPAIGVAYVEFLRARAEYKTARNLQQLWELPDITWAENDAVFELQRQFVEGNSSALLEFCNRSDKIVCSPDGHDVIIIRNHHAWDSGKGFREMNRPPKPESGYSTQVINFFSWSKNGSSWGKAVLPRDANANFIRCNGERCHLQIRQTTTERILSFNAPAAMMGCLRGISLFADGFEDAELWKQLQNVADQLVSDSEVKTTAE